MMMMKQLALYPGSFDPVTKGHEDLIRRAASLFEKVVVAVAYNPNKQVALFAVEERLAFLRQSVEVMGLTNVTVTQFSGLTVKFAKQIGASVIIRGLRVISDFEYECSMYQANRTLEDSIDTMFLMPSLEYQFLSSRMVREIAYFQGDITSFVSSNVAAALIDKVKGGQATVTQPIALTATSTE
jgi:pantetheine-phosphate adenylyltransferase